MKNHVKEKKFNILVSDNDEYKDIWINEYNMMREELVNYMNMLQTVRNMMYIGVAAAFAFAFSDKSIFICSLLPLVFILPAYQCAVNYWNSVRKASAYMVVFHESYKDCPYHWESRHNMYRHDNKENFKKSTYFNISSQLAAYYVCASVTMMFYVLRLYMLVVRYMRANESATFCDVVVDEINVWFYIVVGIITVIFMFVFFVRRSKGESYNVMLADFLAIKDNEVQTKIGMCWKDGESVMEKDNEIRINAMMDGYLKEIGKYL